ncbi:MAG: sensor histidine kinase [Terriglobales bacterium]
MARARAEASQRLSYVSQYRELVLGVLLALLLSLRVLGYAVPLSALVLFALWLLLAVGFFRLGTVLEDERHRHQVALGYFLAELLLITAIAWSLHVPLWLALLFLLVTVLHAHVTLARAPARGVTALATAAFVLLVARAGGAGPVPLAAALAGTAALVYVLAGGNLSRLALVLRRQSEALLAANDSLSATTQELRLHRDHLEEMVRQRTSDLERASEELRQANAGLRRLNQLKSNFLANVSHELRTPLTSIRSFSEILLRYPDEDLATRTEFLGIISSESLRLTRLIDEVLDLAKIEAGRLQLHPRALELAEVLRSSAEVFQLMAAENGLRLEIDIEDGLPPVLADPDRLRQVLTNLLSNACKFTEQGVIRIGARRDAGAMLVEVTDTGIGIPPGEEERIFASFHQAGDGLTGKPKGAGLGLAICCEICALHGGRIWAERLSEGGSRFCFTLPLAPAAQLAAPA